jgi:uncharacterized protein (TIGR02679 family)
VDGSRRDLFRYLTAEESADYLAIMDMFSATLLTDLSAGEVAGQLAERGVSLPRDTAEMRCRQLADWGNLVPSIRDARVATVAEYIRSRSRYQVSKLGGRLHRQAVEILRASDGAREVARELLGQIVQSLDRVLAMLGTDPADGDALDAEALAGEVTTVFSNQRLFTDSVRDFYAYLAGILSRYDLTGEEYAQFKELLLVYIDLITADVNRHAPAVAHRADLVLAQADRVLQVLATLPGLTSPDGTQVERAQGRTRTDWEELVAWYDASHGASGPEQLRGAAGQALGQLITNAKRLLDSSGTGFSRRADFLAGHGLASQDWTRPWTDWLHRGGVLTRLPADQASQALAVAAGTLAKVLAIDQPPTGIAELASAMTGDAHGLDDGAPTTALVLRGLALALDVPPPASAAERRLLWQRVGISTDEISGTVITYGLRPPGTDRWSAMMRERADLGLITHLTVHELRRAGELTRPGEIMHACENPQVLQRLAAAGVDRPLACTSGNPAAAGSLLLGRAVVRYHGDFDWPGIAIARRIIDHGGQPWRLGCADYREAVERLPADRRLMLTGRAEATPWDRGLSPAMVAANVAVHEEAIVDLLLADLAD